MAKQYLIRKPDEKADKGLQFGLQALLRHTDFSDEEAHEIAALNEGEKLDFEKGKPSWFQVTCLEA